jgi:uncharacterized membrane protein AbrB (regulator of aidB expression)
MRFHRHLDRSSRLLYASLVANFALYGITLTTVGASFLTGVLIESCCLFFVARSPLPAPNMALFFGLGMGQGVTEVATNYEVVRMEKEGESGLMTLIFMRRLERV